MKISLMPLVSLAFMAPQAFSLVEYGDGPYESSAPQTAPISTQKAPALRTQKSAAFPSYFLDSGVSFESVDINTRNLKSSARKVNMEGRFSTDYSVFVDFSYWMAQSTDKKVAEDDSFQKGNPELRLGFNWFSFGGDYSKASVDFYGGISVGQSDSDFASGRTDQVYGLETSKRISQFLLGLSGEFRVSGESENPREVAIGNIRKIGAAIGWRVSHDIRLMAQAYQIMVSKTDESGPGGRLDTDVSFSSIEAKAMMNLAPHIALGIGGLVQVDRPSETDNLLGARLWNLPGAYGSSLYASLSVAL